MTSAAALLILLVAAAVACIAKPTRSRSCGTTPPTAEQREDGWKDRLDKAIGLRSEEYLAMRARGIADKRRLLARLQAIERKNRESDPRSVVSALPMKKRPSNLLPRTARGSGNAA